MVVFARWCTATTSKATIQAANFTNAEGTIIGLEKKWAEAIVNRDMGTLNEIIADDFTGTAWSGDTYSKTKAVDDIEFRITSHRPWISKASK